MLGLVVAGKNGFAQVPFLSNLNADKNFPIYTTYAASQERSQFLLDKGYELRWYNGGEPVYFHNAAAGSWWMGFDINGRLIQNLEDYYQAPVIKKSYPDLVEMEMEPVEKVRITLRFLVWSSRMAICVTEVSNALQKPLKIAVISGLQKRDAVWQQVQKHSKGFSFSHSEPPDNWMRAHEMPHIEDVMNYFGSDRPVQFFSGDRPDLFSLANKAADTHADSVRQLAIRTNLTVQPGKSATLKTLRAVAPAEESPDSLVKSAQDGFAVSWLKALGENEARTARVQKPAVDSNRLPLYWSNVNMMRQVFYPPEGKSGYNYYVFSREPIWGWGHGGQVFHESITMLAYARVDPLSALNSQRIYRERQYENGYINYRTGAYLDEIIEHNGELTSSAPWYNWLNAELHRMTGDSAFLEEMYPSGKKYYEFVVNNRDKDGDGLCEWGGHAILESVRDGRVAVWDEVGNPTHFESLDLNCMLVMEAKSLEYMARQLGLSHEADKWKEDYMRRTELINRYFWDEENGFYYNVTREGNTFSFKDSNDLKRDEIIGFIPLWAGIASPSQASRLVEKLTDEQYFWRPGGIPTLAANDSYYHPQGYWNGPVWVQWNYLIVRGLLDYGYKPVARELTGRVTHGMNEVLRKTHNLWELYSPEEAWGGHHKTYIWAGIANRMMEDVQ